MLFAFKQLNWECNTGVASPTPPTFCDQHSSIHNRRTPRGFTLAYLPKRGDGGMWDLWKKTLDKYEGQNFDIYECAWLRTLSRKLGATNAMTFARLRHARPILSISGQACVTHQIILNEEAQQMVRAIPCFYCQSRVACPTRQFDTAILFVDFN